MLQGIDLTNPITDTHYELDRFEELGDDFEDDLLGHDTAHRENTVIRETGETSANDIVGGFDWKWLLIIAAILVALWLLYRYQTNNSSLSLAEIRRILGGY